ncbi:MAG: helix-turn-helix domain-containing protein [Xanthomonadales bacterium]|nr:helix-turn-helix domain-containing protein [Xanthomonadales bacterium]
MFSLFDLLVLIGLTQGVITSILLLRSNKNKLSNKFLALALLTFCLLSSKVLLGYLGLTDIPILRYIPFGVEYALAPLLYFYVVSLITPKFKFKKKNLVHFIPFAIFQSYAFLVYFSVVGFDLNIDKDQYIAQLYYESIKRWEDYLVLVSIISYLTASFFKLKHYQLQLKETTSDNTFPTFNWLMRIFVLSSVLGLIILINLSLDLFLDFKQRHDFHWQALYVYIAFLIYYLGFVGYQQPKFEIEGIEEKEKNKKTRSLSDEKASQIAGLIKNALDEDYVYLNPTLSAKELAKSLKVSQANLSYVVNYSFGMTFKDLINKHRVQRVKEKLNDKNSNSLSILAIALECGFNSEASFYRVFKKETGLSPKEYSQK